MKTSNHENEATGFKVAVPELPKHPRFRMRDGHAEWQDLCGVWINIEEMRSSSAVGMKHDFWSCVAIAENYFQALAEHCARDGAVISEEYAIEKERNWRLYGEQAK